MKATKLVLLVLAFGVSLSQAAITRVQSKTANSGSAGVTSQSVVLDSAPTAGNYIVLVAVSGITAAPEDRFTVDNTSGIIWTGKLYSSANNVIILMMLGRVFSGASATITVSIATSSRVAMVAAEYSGTNLRLDKEMAATGSSTSLASGATATTANANELWVGGMGQRASSAITFSSPTNSFSIVGQTTSTGTATNNERAAALLERIVTSTGTANAGVTSDQNFQWAAMAMTFEETPTGATTTIPSIGY